ncbi:SIR2 family protein [Qipengyuania sp. 1XM1-15A]|uniref:SIR2 family protein n=1 Tax=Qipengyuania xiamenensis TaxID=2867237 RepID=UPI001C86CC49|nr:SIR2 family protein [Qipengyuania xiamenensis]MBX7531703.1 SIR2 family protein [Qipengyuania xiamenensis]
MRFFSDGPDIPSHLLGQQAQGNVVFFCGAGVSIPAGLDSFWQLTDRIVTALDSEEGREALNEDADFDRIFNLLVKRYGREEVDRQIFLALGTKRAKTLAHHRAILHLAKNAAGATQLVTTNFDLLFERAGCKSAKIIPPNLPNLELNRTLEGIVYLHGRLVDTDKADPRYVISSADFGRAYLAEGWAAKFVRELRETFTLVFLGYSADDPPMRYLLEGMHDREGVNYANPIYAFAADDPRADNEVWIDRGVTPIIYDPTDRHAKLWETIHAWSEAATNPDAWTAKVLSLAQAGPRAIEPHERGQVVELVSNKRGAAAFAKAEPTPTSEWLCVFDPNARYAAPRKVSWEDDAPELDPQSVYGLDSDPPRPPKSENRLYRSYAKNPLQWNEQDGEGFDQPTLQGTFQIFHRRLPARLHHLASWFGKVCGEPAAIWWSAGWSRISQHLIWFVARRLRDRHGGKLPEAAADFWSYYLEHLDSFAFDEHEYRWFEFEGLLKTLGWTGHSLRYLERCLSPTVIFSRPSMGSPIPPDGDWDKLSFSEVASLSVKVLDRHNTKLPIPDEQLSSVLKLLRNALLKMSALLDEVEDRFWRPPNLHPSQKPGERYHGRKEQLVIWFSQLFESLASTDLASAQAEWNEWPKFGHRVFTKVGLWAASIDGVADNASVFRLLQNLSAEDFWTSDNQRDVLLLLKQRWPSFTIKQRRALERRLEDGPPHWPYLEDEDYPRRKASHAATRLRWLELNGCVLSKPGANALRRLKNVDKRFTDQWAETADESLGPRGGLIAEDTDTQGLEVFPVSKIIEEAEKRTGENFGELKHYRPFKGLVETEPFLALSALRRRLKDGDFNPRYWDDLLNSWPKRTPLRLRLLLGLTLANLSNEQILHLRYSSTAWLQKNLPVLYRVRPKHGLSICDGVIQAFESASPEFTKSSVSSASVDGEKQQESAASRMKVINSPVGHLTEAIWSLTPKNSEAPTELSSDIRERLEALCRVPGDGGHHAVASLLIRLDWIIFKYPQWANQFILPMLDLRSPKSEAAWHGFVLGRNQLPNSVWEQIRDDLLAILRSESPWNMGKEGRKSLISMAVALSNPNWSTTGAILSFSDVRRVLKTVGEEERGHALWELGNLWREPAQWQTFIKPFLEKAWPLEKRFRSEQSTRGFIHLADKAGEHFPDLVKTVKRFLKPVAHADTFTYRLSKDTRGEDSHIKKHPHEAILLLDAITGDDRVSVPYGLAESLEILGEIDPAVRQTGEFRRLRNLVD